MDKKTDHNVGDMDAEARCNDTVAKLMNLAGPRADIPADLEKRVHENVRQQWSRSTNRNRAVKWAIPTALAATMLIAIAINMRAPETLQQSIGTIAYVANTSNLIEADFEIGDAVYAGDTVETDADRGVSISLVGDISLRIAAGTSIRFDQADEFTLVRGKVYADSGDRIYRDRHITVHTAKGSATDIGTQFSVAYDDHRMSVAVREGRVDVASDNASYTAQAGDRMTFQPGADVEFDRVTPYDPSWHWATSLAPSFDIENRSLMEFLKWVSRETGKTLVFSSDDVRMAAMRTEIFGSILNFTPPEAIDSVLSTTRFKYRFDEKSITITK